MENIRINTPPSITWHRLGINEKNIYGIAYSGQNTKGKLARTKKTEISDLFLPESREYIPGAAGAEFDDLMGNGSVIITADEKTSMTLEYVPDSASGERIYCEAADREKKVVIIKHLCPGQSDNADMLSSVRAKAGKGSRLKIINIFDTGKGRVISDLCVEAEEEAKVESYDMILSGADVSIGRKIVLSGKMSEFEGAVGYLGKDEGRIDINYIISQEGKKTKSNLSVFGALKDRAKKTFRGTIDFKNGSSGSTGSENEDVLLIGDTVENKTMPVILCSEEDVEGSHGASIGKVDENLMFYLMSRGNDAESICKMLEKSKINAVVSEAGEEEVAEYIERVM